MRLNSEYSSFVNICMETGLPFNEYKQESQGNRASLVKTFKKEKKRIKFGLEPDKIYLKHIRYWKLKSLLS